MAPSQAAKADPMVESENDEDHARAKSPLLGSNDREDVADEDEARGLLERGNSRHDAPGRRKKRRRRQGARQAEKERMYEMEEGGPRSSSAESSGHSSEVDLRRLGQTQARRKSRWPRVCAFTGIHVLIVLAFLTLLYGAYRASSQARQGGVSGSAPSAEEKEGDDINGPLTPFAKTLSNGTHTFAPTTILISLDGFRADFLHRNLTPTLNSFVRSGVSPKFMTPSFPSLTFPNHFTLVTGLHPESHGIVGNTFWDPVTEKEFYYTDPARSMTSEWWNAEPVWETAELAGLKTAIHMWPGSEAHIGAIEPAYVDHFNAEERLDRKVSRVLGWLDLPGANDSASNQHVRPQLIAMYVPDVDADGHSYGPNSTYIRSTIREVDGMLGALFRGIDERNLTQIVNVVVVSDHGMATTSVDRLIQLEDLVDTALIEHTDGWPLYGLRPYNHSEAHLQSLYEQLLLKAALPPYKGTFDVYLRDTNMPDRYHFANNARIAPLWIVPQPGWAIVTRDEFDVAAGQQQSLVYHPRGLHGYDNDHPLMRAIFVARGPAFPHPEGSQVDPFQNTEVYNIVCDSLGIQPKANNGTLRLPFKPSGLHDFTEIPEASEDLPDDDGNGEPQYDDVVPNLANRPDFMLPTANIPPVPQPTPESQHENSVTEHPAEPTRPVVHDGISEEEEKGDINLWMEWVHGKISAIKNWASGVFGSAANEKANGTVNSLG